MYGLYVVWPISHSVPGKLDSRKAIGTGISIAATNSQEGIYYQPIDSFWQHQRDNHHVANFLRFTHTHTHIQEHRKTNWNTYLSLSLFLFFFSLSWLFKNWYNYFISHIGDITHWHNENSIFRTFATSDFLYLFFSRRNSSKHIIVLFINKRTYVCFSLYTSIFGRGRLISWRILKGLYFYVNIFLRRFPWWYYDLIQCSSNAGDIHTELYSNLVLIESKLS